MHLEFNIQGNVGQVLFYCTFKFVKKITVQKPKNDVFCFLLGILTDGVPWLTCPPPLQQSFYTGSSVFSNGKVLELSYEIKFLFIS